MKPRSTTTRYQLGFSLIEVVIAIGICAALVMLVNKLMLKSMAVERQSLALQDTNEGITRLAQMIDRHFMTSSQARLTTAIKLDLGHRVLVGNSFRQDASYIETRCVPNSHKLALPTHAECPSPCSPQELPQVRVVRVQGTTNTESTLAFPANMNTPTGFVAAVVCFQGLVSANSSLKGLILGFYRENVSKEQGAIRMLTRDFSIVRSASNSSTQFLP